MTDKALRRRPGVVILGFALAAAAISASTMTAEARGRPLPQGSEPANISPSDFVTTIDHPYWPMAPGNRWVYRETNRAGDSQRVEVTVTNRTREIQGIQATVVHDLVTEDGEKVENTFDWYAQDTDGNLWYLGENTKEYEDGKVVSTEGSWEHGVDGAEAGVILPGDPQVGQAYREEYYAGQAEDEAKILSLDEMAQIPYGFFENVLMTKNFTPIEPKVLEHKFYARGVGPVLEMGISGGSDQAILLHFRTG